MTETEVVAWIAKNWPTLALVLVMGRVYLRINSFVEEQKKQKKILKAVVGICSDQHEDSAKKLMEAMEDDK